MDVYIGRRHKMAAQYIVIRPIINLSLEVYRSLGGRVATLWREQPGLQFEVEQGGRGDRRGIRVGEDKGIGGGGG